MLSIDSIRFDSIQFSDALLLRCCCRYPRWIAVVQLIYPCNATPALLFSAKTDILKKTCRIRNYTQSLCKQHRKLFECNSRCSTSPCKTVLFSSKLRKLLTFLIICFATQIQIKLPLSLAEATSTFRFPTVFVELKSSSIVMLAIVVGSPTSAHFARSW